ncbi:anhydro-N-acetylmuramic acid kinase [Bacillus shivajii]|uniref:anhydro-N-acetylmuramic acid kinase n=1 Tax=Bacillus shivajii TaxID=1983719 RepID=UPI001CFA6587|nr:anhydro-N-acetylmuramic acid kinase [Bacillus shivajii]UCZ52977.1 anhydro-N-acetylmuramic acid kinase [Bacillus shivajii]
MTFDFQFPLKKERVLAVGLMSGTSVDGVDAALVEIEGSADNTKVNLLKFETLEYDEDLKQRILQLCKPETSSVDEICEMNVLLGEKMADAAKKVVSNSEKSMDEIDFISSHGQTIYHMPEKYATLQIGELAVIANRTGCLTVGDFRPNDLAAGGQGAPLVPFVDQILFKDEHKGRVLINIGGISNLTVLPANASNTDQTIYAFDIGPGNVLIDEMVRIGTNGKLDYDESGKIGARGTVHESWLNEIIASDPFISRPYPKSTGRELYTRTYAKELYNAGIKRNYPFEDIVATITYYTVIAIVSTVKEQIDPDYKIDEVFVGGGGVHNAFLMGSLQKELSRPVQSMERIDFSSDAKEAIAFAILGNEFLRNQPNTLPSATGADKPTVMGKLTFP